MSLLFRLTRHPGHTSLKALLAKGCALVCLFISAAIQAEQSVIVIASSNAEIYQEAVDAFIEDLESRDSEENYIFKQFLLPALIESGLPPSQPDVDTVVVTIGSAAADYAIQHFKNTGILCGFITRNAFTSITSKSSNTNKVSAVFMDQPLQRLMNLAALLQEAQSPYTIGMLSQNALELEALLRQSNEQNPNHNIRSGVLTKGDNPIKTIEPLMQSSDIFIVRPNTRLFNRLVAKLVLQLSMRYKTPVIGFSQKYAQAGALLSIYASPKDIGQDTADKLHTWLQSPTQKPPRPGEGKYFSIVSNEHIAKKMSKNIDAKRLQTLLQDQETN